MIKFVLFDWNGTILADTVPIVKVINFLFAKIGGRKIDIRTYREHMSVIIMSQRLKFS